jgi:hypothetical protein
MASHSTEGADMHIKHLNQIDLSRRWNISHRTLERWRWKREGPVFIRLGGRIVYRLEDVLAFERNHLSTATAGCPGDFAKERAPSPSGW